MTLQTIIQQYRTGSEPGRTRDGEAYLPLLGAWLIELALLFNWHRSDRRRRCDLVECEHFCRLTGLVEPDEDELPQPPKVRTRKRDNVELSRWVHTFLQKRHDVTTGQLVAGDLPLFKTIDLLAELLGMTDADRFLLLFTAMLRLFRDFSSAIENQCSEVTTAEFCGVLARLSGLQEHEFYMSVSDRGILVATGLIQINSGNCDLEEKAAILTILAGNLLTPYENVHELCRLFLRRVTPGQLSLAAFPHLAEDSAIVSRYLGNALRDRTTGVNILLHGLPGVGKTEYAKAVAVTLGCELYEITSVDKDGDPIKGEGRLQAYSLCQELLANNGNSLLLFDEIEDVFPTGSGALRQLFGRSREAIVSKAWINRTIEENPVPALWVSNEIGQIDPAYLRRFDYSIRFTVPPAEVRLSVARHHLESFQPPPGWLQRIATVAEMTPGQLARAAKVARVTAGDDQDEARNLVVQTLDRSSALLGHKQQPGAGFQTTGYDLELLNLDTDITLLLSGLQRRRRGTFCFYGAAGTGKSELARHLAAAIGAPLLPYRASDLLDRYVGGTEQQIAGMFQTAQAQRGVLLLDEADSFLADRRQARHSWEVTQVNELLTRMESYDGVFICTTNLMDRLDPACLRRFDFKIRFEPLTPSQGRAMFRQELQRLGGDTTRIDLWEERVARLHGLTPGDFAVVVKQFELLGTTVTPDAFYAGLSRECAAKGAMSRNIGFAVPPQDAIDRQAA